MPTCSISLDGVAQQSSSIYSIEYQFKFLPGNLLRKLQVSLNSTFFSFFGGDYCSNYVDSNEIFKKTFEMYF